MFAITFYKLVLGFRDKIKTLFVYLFGGLECVGHFFANVTFFVVLRLVWIRTKRDTVACRCATNLASHLPKYSTELVKKSKSAPY